MRLFFILKLLCGTVFLSDCSSPAAEPPEKPTQRPNIVFIMSDDHAYQAVSAYGGPLAQFAPTPNIDRLAQEGMLFNRCLVTNSICGPSRAAILTGRYSHLNGFVDNTLGTRFDFSQQTFTKILQEAGYKTAMIGKLHLGGVPTGFDYFDILPGQGSYYNPVFINDSGRYEMEGYTTEIITDKTIEWLKGEEANDQPFMVMMQHKAPHRAWEPGPNELGMYEAVTFPEPATLFDDYRTREAASKNFMSIADAMRMDSDLKMHEGRRSNLNDSQMEAWKAVYQPIYEYYQSANLEGEELVRFKYQRYMRDYLASVAAVDKSVGRLLDYLETSGQAENTIVVYTSDQGFYLGEHGWFDKRWMYEESMRTPLLVRWPGVVKPQSVNNDLVSNIDFGETFLDVAGAPIPEDMQGKSLVSILKGETPADWRKAHYYHYYEHPSEHYVKRHYGIATDRYKLIHYYYDEESWELFDLKADPEEMNNIYGNPDYAAIQADLSEQLEQLRDKYQDSDSMNQYYIEEYHRKVKENPIIEYWTFTPEERQKLWQEYQQKQSGE